MGLMSCTIFSNGEEKWGKPWRKQGHLILGFSSQRCVCVLRPFLPSIATLLLRPFLSSWLSTAAVTARAKAPVQ